MKKILFAMAVLAALTSCQKADLTEQNSVNTNGERVITAYFDNAGTKTTLDENGITPKWAPNDKIMLLNGSNHDEITLGESNISADGKSVTITTTLLGPLYAVYPSTAAGAEEIETENIVPVTLSAEDQDGTFASANICVAKEDDGKLAFKNVTSVLHLTQTEATTNVNEIIITTPSADIAGTGTVNIGDATPALTLSSGQSNKIKVKSASAKSDYYIAVAPTTLPAGTAFGFATGSKLGGTNLSEERAIVANTIYNIGSMDVDAIKPNTYHDYVEINGLKWATMNIGAATSSDAGLYFAWGETTGHAAVTNGNNAFVTGFDDNAKGFSWANCPLSNHYYGDGTDYFFSKYVPQDKADLYGIDGYYDDKKVLDFEDDAARANWGGSWRMPTKEEYDALLTATNTDNTCFSNGVLTINGHSDLTFPAVGYGNGTDLKSLGTFSCYRSSSLYTKMPDANYCLSFYKDGIATDSRYRYTGYPVRALSE